LIDRPPERLETRIAAAESRSDDPGAKSELTRSRQADEFFGA
jgi:hypothetical protein